MRQWSYIKADNILAGFSATVANQGVRIQKSDCGKMLRSLIFSFSQVSVFYKITCVTAGISRRKIELIEVISDFTLAQNLAKRIHKAIVLGALLDSQTNI